MHIKNVCYRVILELEIAYKNCSIKLKKKNFLEWFECTKCNLSDFKNCWEKFFERKPHSKRTWLPCKWAETKTLPPDKSQANSWD